MKYTTSSFRSYNGHMVIFGQLGLGPVLYENPVFGGHIPTRFSVLPGRKKTPSFEAVIYLVGQYLPFRPGWFNTPAVELYVELVPPEMLFHFSSKEGWAHFDFESSLLCFCCCVGA